MSSFRTYRYMVRAASQAEKDVVEIRQRNMAAAKGEFLRLYPQFQDEEIVCRLYNEADKYSEAMDSETQGYM